MKVWELLTRKGPPVHSVDEAEPVAAAIKKLVSLGVRALPVVDGKRLVGIITVRDILAGIDRLGGAALDGTVGSMMTRDVRAVRHDSPVEEVERIFDELKVNHVPVLEDGRLVGLLTPADVFSAQLHDAEWSNEHLREYLIGSRR